MCGQDPESFYRLTLREIDLVQTAALVRDAQQAWLVGAYLGFPYHKEGEAPERPTLTPKPDEEGTEADRAYVVAWMKAMANGN